MAARPKCSLTMPSSPSSAHRVATSSALSPSLRTGSVQRHVLVMMLNQLSQLVHQMEPGVGGVDCRVRGMGSSCQRRSASWARGRLGASVATIR
ncbi:hypothetical protein BG418_10575 [Streptomyces sp. CBMA152]|nr:hypothetical protein [Streptomyces sp. CBMA152]